MNSHNLHKSDIVYHTRIYPTLGIYDLDELKIRTVTEDYFVWLEKKEKKAFLFPYSSIGKTDALNKVKEAEKNKVYVSEETYYEEY